MCVCDSLVHSTHFHSFLPVFLRFFVSTSFRASPHGALSLLYVYIHTNRYTKSNPRPKASYLAPLHLILLHILLHIFIHTHIYIYTYTSIRSNPIHNRKLATLPSLYIDSVQSDPIQCTQCKQTMSSPPLRFTCTY